jgi:hypothetical protein
VSESSRARASVIFSSFASDTVILPSSGKPSLSTTSSGSSVMTAPVSTSASISTRRGASFN